MILEKFKQLSLYHIFSIIKILIALIILISLYITIDPYADPLVALSWWMIGFFLLAWWCSFFAFWAWKKYIKHDEGEIIISSYKLSLLFGIYILFNVIFLLKEQRTLLWWIALLIWFIIIQWILIPVGKHSSKLKK